MMALRSAVCICRQFSLPFQPWRLPHFSGLPERLFQWMSNPSPPYFNKNLQRPVPPHSLLPLSGQRVSWSLAQPDSQGLEAEAYSGLLRVGIVFACIQGTAAEQMPKNFKSQIRLGEFVAYSDQAGMCFVNGPPGWPGSGCWDRGLGDFMPFPLVCSSPIPSPPPKEAQLSVPTVLHLHRRGPW